MSIIQLYLNNIVFVTKMYELYRKDKTSEIIIIEEKFYIKLHDGLFIKDCLTNRQGYLIFDILNIVKYIDDKNDITELILKPSIIINSLKSGPSYADYTIIRDIAQYYFNKKTQDDIKILTDENKKLRELLFSYIKSGSIL